MRRLILILPTLILIGTSSVLGDEQLVWCDEFDGTAVDTTLWEFMIGDGSQYGLNNWGNNELQYYTSRPENAVVNGGMLHIIARQESFGGKNYTSARLRTLNNGDFLYGRFEARIKLPSTPGIWPAFWMLPTGSPYGGWAASGEIDIMESVNFADTIHGTIHYGDQWPNNTLSGGTWQNGTDYSADFHVYAVEWTPQFLRWYVDGNPYFTRVASNWFSSAAPGDDNAPFDTPFHLLLNVAVGGNFPGNPNGSSVFPQEMIVDWVRVYQDVPQQEPFLGAPHPIPGRIEAEDYDLGGQDVAYNDCDVTNNGNAFRLTEGVDLQASTESGFNVGWLCAGEWIEYTVSVAESHDYQFEARVASDQNGGQFRIEMDGNDVTGNITFVGTGGWQNWTTISTDASLAEGVQVMRFVNTGTTEEFNVNWFRFTSLCTKGDLNADGFVNGDDISKFVQTVTMPGDATPAQLCASDTNGDGAIDVATDVAGLVGLLLP